MRLIGYLARVLLLSVAVLEVSAAQAGRLPPEVQFAAGDRTRFFITLDGLITKRLALGLAELEAHGARPYALRVRSSAGGDIEAAMAVGRFLRKYEVPAMVAGPCASACVLVIAGAVSRQYDDAPNVRIGLHRPYALRSEADYTATKARVDARNTALRGYLSEMNVPASFFEAMNAIPSDQMRYVTPSELTQLGLSEVDPIYEEFKDGESARRLQISRIEYLSRRAQFRDECKPLGYESTAFCQCVDRIGFRAPGDRWECDIAR